MKKKSTWCWRQRAPSKKNLGCWFDSQMNLNTHITKCCNASFYHLFNIRRIRKFLNKETAQILVNAFITSRLDYCNSLLYGLPATHLNKLQRVQNASARLICNVSRYDHITPTLYQLHWLPIKFRIDFKILLITYKAIHGLAPDYLTELISIKTPTLHDIILEQAMNYFFSVQELRPKWH